VKKPTGSIRFYKSKTEKIEPNWTQTKKNPEKNRAKPEKTRKKTEPNWKNRAKPEKTEPNRFESVFVLKNRT